MLQSTPAACHPYRELASPNLLELPHGIFTNTTNIHTLDPAAGSRCPHSIIKPCLYCTQTTCLVKLSVSLRPTGCAKPAAATGPFSLRLSASFNVTRSSKHAGASGRPAAGRLRQPPNRLTANCNLHEPPTNFSCWCCWLLQRRQGRKHTRRKSS